MKLLILSLLLALSNGFMVAPVHTAPKTALSAATAFNKPMAVMSETSADEKRLSGVNKIYQGVDGSTILGPSFRLALEIAAMAPLIWYAHSDNFAAVDQAGLYGAGFHVVLAGWIGLQANRVRTVFDKEAVEFYNLKGMGASYLAGPAKDPRLQKKPNNWVVASTANRWNYKTITGYRFYPSIEFPVVCILWENETQQNRNSIGTQPHFFPSLMNAKHFKAEMEKNNVPYV